MQIIHRYITRDFMVIFLMTLAILTFVMCMGAAIKAIDILSRGVSGFVILKFFGFNVAFLMMFAIPMSVLTASLLLAGRLSLEGEVTAMRACGMSIWQIVSPLLIISVMLTVFCFYIAGWLAPDQRHARRNLVRELGVEDPVNLLEEGRFSREFPGMIIYVGSKDGNAVEDVVIYRFDEQNRVEVNLRAKSGEIRSDEARRKLVVDLYDVRIDQPDPSAPLDPSQAQTVAAGHYPLELDFDKVMRTGKHRKKFRDMTLTEIMDYIENLREYLPELREDDLSHQRIRLVIEANKRLTLAMSCFAFTLIGFPLGLKSRRKESSIGILMSIVIVFVFYLFTIIAEAMDKYPEWRPDLVLWIPIVLMEAAGFYMLFRSR